MKIFPVSPDISETQKTAAQKLIIREGVFTEAMTTLTGTVFLTAMVLLAGGTNVQIGFLAALPSFVNLFQLLSVWLVRTFNNRRFVSVTCSVLARVPLLILGIFIVNASDPSIHLILVLLFFYYLFGSVAGPGWNAWMKDLIPEKSLGAFFSRRTRYMQIINLLIGILLAFLLDFIRKNKPAYEMFTYGMMFICAGIIGLSGIGLLAKVPEPTGVQTKEKLLTILKYPLRDRNFRKLLTFQSIWIFAVNMTTPFFTVFLLKSMQFPLLYVIGFTLVSQLSSIITIQAWGRFSDRYSNKSILAVTVPIYILCLIAWCFVGLSKLLPVTLVLLAVIHILTGIANAGINQSINNISLKLSPARYSIVYLSTKNIITSAFAFLGPLTGGILADFFMNRSLNISADWDGPRSDKMIYLFSLHDYNFLFLIGAFVAFIAAEMLLSVKEEGEVNKSQVVRVIRSTMKSNLKEYFVIGQLISWNDRLKKVLKGKMVSDTEQKK